MRSSPSPHRTFRVKKLVLRYVQSWIEFLRLLIVETDSVRFRAHELNTCDDKRSDGEHNDIIPHEQKRNGSGAMPNE